MSVLSPLERAKIGIEGFSEKHSAKRCWLFHDWERWSETHRGTINRSRDKAIIGHMIAMERHCNTCGEIQVRTLKTML